jgi:hypothetical protein
VCNILPHERARRRRFAVSSCQIVVKNTYRLLTRAPVTQISVLVGLLAKRDYCRHKF